MYELKKKYGKVFTRKFVWTGPSSYEKRIYRSAVPQRLRNTRLKYTNRMTNCKVFVSSEIALKPSSCTQKMRNI